MLIAGSNRSAHPTLQRALPTDLLGALELASMDTLRRGSSLGLSNGEKLGTRG